MPAAIADVCNQQSPDRSIKQLRTFRCARPDQNRWFVAGGGIVLNPHPVDRELLNSDGASQEKERLPAEIQGTELHSLLCQINPHLREEQMIDDFPLDLLNGET